MSRGKYSLAYHAQDQKDGFNYKGEEPLVYEDVDAEDPMRYNLCRNDFSKEGYDRYGYTCFSLDGEYLGDGEGVDSKGYTEMDYLTLIDIPEEHRESYYYYNS